jgi:hypothetical protein
MGWESRDGRDAQALAHVSSGLPWLIANGVIAR